MGKEIFLNPVVLFIASVILFACNNSANVDRTERFLLDVGYTTEMELIEKQRNNSESKNKKDKAKLVLPFVFLLCFVALI